MSVSTGTTFGFIQLFYLDEIALFVLGKHHLGDALPVVDDEVFLREVDEQHHDFAAIVGINGARRVEHGDAMLQGKTAARTYLRLISHWQSHEKARRNQSALHRMEHDGFVDVSTQVHARTLRCGKRRERLMPLIDNLYFQHNSRIFCKNTAF